MISCASMSIERETGVMADPVHDETVRVGLLGCGHVGSALVRLLQENAELI
jgi:phosphoglycerate dehydrogenase-like enzyme